ncbi:hypothetical protein GCM10010512_42310 [Streptomyces thermoviolaceus subsp. thermoviolaceus]|uniref:Secreted protein n=2 Tax=Streptomyces TaxID=1883 RepID=A0ABX0YUD7_STRTL|nr:hypothetical protein [Streptomyces thermoviolaceus subsp. thermoviolaceus]RSR97129.1 hypothetical protein EF917_22545 [Streptomyces sp. WAC00469]GGV69266.1 hypothetical protein GCM10010499_17600 [Streptomyces thermoviolaceus subsp. apingens]GHB06367.1 hypothetical protein GCM10010512_42310 [Streptomyces thermoviolaceus subsp. thermoviolaceus]
MVAVVLALTGFSRGGHGRGHGSDGEGGGSGCSSSRQNHDSSSGSGGVSKDDGSDYDSGYGSGYSSGYGSGYGGGYRGSYHHGHDDTDDDTSGSGGSGTGYSTLESATTELLSCATSKKRYAMVKVTNPNDVYGTFEVTIRFTGAGGMLIDSVVKEASVPAGDSVTVRIEPDLSADGARRLKHCDLNPTAPATS